MSNTPILISGASGLLGQTVVQTLIQQGIHKKRQLILATRSPEKLNHFKQPGVEIRQADFDLPTSLSSAFHGAKRMLLISTNLLDGTGKRVQQHRNAIEAATHAGVNHVVYTSFIQPLHGLSMPPAKDHLATEALIKQSTLGYTLLRNAFYYDMLLPLIKQALATGNVISATGHAATAYIDRQDCAKAAAHALLLDESASSTLTLIGETLSIQTLIERLTLIMKRTVSYQAISLEQKLQEFIAVGLPVGLAQLLVGIDKSLSQSALDIYSTDFEQLTGTRPILFSDFLSHYLGVDGGMKFTSVQT